MNKCEYGCNRPGIFFLSYVKKWCCEDRYYKCPDRKLEFIKNNPSKREEVKEKKRQSYLNHYGVEHPMFSIELKEKKQKTCLDKYGVTHAMMNDDIKKKIQKTHMKKYGKYYTQTDEYKEKTKKSCMEKYGVDSQNKSEGIKIKKEQNCLKKWGTKNVFQLEEIKNKSKNTMLEKYGVEYNLQRSNMMKYQYAIKKYTMPSGRIISIQGNEGIAIDNLLKKYNENDIFVEDVDIEKQIGYIWYLYDNKKHRYFPDIFIKSKNKIIEVKSEYTYKANEEINLLKKDACLQKGLSFDFIIIK